MILLLVALKLAPYTDVLDDSPSFVCQKNCVKRKKNEKSSADTELKTKNNKNKVQVLPIEDKKSKNDDHVKSWGTKPRLNTVSTVIGTNFSFAITIMMLVGSLVVGVAEGTSVLDSDDATSSLDVLDNVWKDEAFHIYWS